MEEETSHRGQKRGSHRRRGVGPKERSFQQGTAHGVRGHNDQADHESETNRLFCLEAQAKGNTQKRKGDTFQGTTRSTLEEGILHTFVSFRSQNKDFAEKSHVGEEPSL